MSDKSVFTEKIKGSYTFRGSSVQIGSAMLDGHPVPEAPVMVPLRMMNRHGLIAGATGTGKTKTLQMLSEHLSDASIPVLLLDIKGDLSGLARPGERNEKIDERYRMMGLNYSPAGYPVELLSLTGKDSVQLRATVSEFGPILLSKILSLNDTQAGVVAVIFKYCDDNGLPLLDLKDFIRVLQFAGNEGKDELEKTYGKISTTTTGTILRKVIELQQQGADLFFGEMSFDVNDLMRVASDGRGVVNILRATDIQDQPRLFSTFMLQMLAELYAVCPEEGDLDKPKLVMFIDEAHLIFKEASKELLSQIETIIKLIRSKGVGIFFCTQNPMDVPAPVLGQLGMKIQHALRAFTAADRKSIKQTAQNYPLTDFYNTEDIITRLGIGEALVTVLSEKGTPTELVHAMLCAPRSRMNILTEDEIRQVVSSSALMGKYREVADRESAYEMLNEKLSRQLAEAPSKEAAPSKEEKEPSRPAAQAPSRKPEPSTAEKMLNNTVTKSMMRTAGNILVRSLLGVLGLNAGRSYKRRK